MVGVKDGGPRRHNQKKLALLHWPSSTHLYKQYFETLVEVVFILTNRCYRIIAQLVFTSQLSKMSNKHVCKRFLLPVPHSIRAIPAQNSGSYKVPLGGNDNAFQRKLLIRMMCCFSGQYSMQLSSSVFVSIHTCFPFFFKVAKAFSKQKTKKWDRIRIPVGQAVILHVVFQGSSLKKTSKRKSRGPAPVHLQNKYRQNIYTLDGLLV